MFCSGFLLRIHRNGETVRAFPARRISLAVYHWNCHKKTPAAPCNRGLGKATGLGLPVASLLREVSRQVTNALNSSEHIPQQEFHRTITY